jgi:two-component system, NtrC family, response regulator AtoC
MTAARILVADDDDVARELLVEVLSREGYAVAAASGGEACLELAEGQPFDLALVDLRMPDLDGLKVLERLTAGQPDLPVIILTAFATMDTAIEAIRAGAYDYLSKPFRMEEIKLTARRTLDARQALRENRSLREELRERYQVRRLVGQSPQMVEIYKLVARVANLETTVLIQGETGTGKELVARAIHYASARADRHFVVVDCAALPETLIESELFGHERGAFTGAHGTRRGLFETAEGGTVFLDEIGELPPALQAKLLRVLQERTIRRVGSNEPIAVDVRVVAASNRDLRKRIDEGEFREDLFYRLNVVAIAVPSLRERRRDIPLLARHFLDKHARTAGKAISGFAPETLEMLSERDWPGNVRELEHAVERAVALSSSPVLLPSDFPAAALRDARDGSGAVLPRPGMTLDEVRSWYIARVLQDVGGNKVRASEVLGIDRKTLYRTLGRGVPEPPEEA